MAEPVDDTTNPDNLSSPEGQGPPPPPEQPAGDQADSLPPAEPEGVEAGPPAELVGPPAPGEPGVEPAAEPAAESAAPGESPEAVGSALATTTEEQGPRFDGDDPQQYAGSENGYDHGQYGSGESGTAEQWQYQEESQGTDGEQQEEENEEEEEEHDGQKKMTLVEHLEELRTRIIRAAIGLAVGMGISLAFGEYTFRFINEPIVKVLGTGKLITTDMMNPFTMYMKISLYVGIVIAAPWIFYQMWMFISAGLYPKERKYVTRSVPFSAALFVGGAVFFVKVVSIPLLKFLKYWNSEIMGLTMMPTQQSHMEFMTDMMLIFGLCFQMPVAILILAKVGFVTIKTLNHYRRHAVIGILVLSAFLSPSPSPLDQLALAIPMWLLYELGVVLTYFLVERKRRREEAEEAAEDAARDAEQRAAAGVGTGDDEPTDAEYEYVDEAETPAEGEQTKEPPDHSDRAG